jgi:2-keto-4-pentenoate hydratase/2-oxohepta-3-ene-1,7-dioic acid hydratase in catechol pathway
MKIVRYQFGKKISYGVIDKDLIQGYRGNPFGKKPNFKPDGGHVHVKEVTLLAPCLPSKVVCLGLNYRHHAQEFNMPIPEIPLLFLKPSTSVIGPEATIMLPAMAERIDYECELAVVIKKEAKNVPEEKYADYILGYTCFNDVTDRVAQAKDGQWTRAKGYDTFAPLGPWIETDVDPSDLKIETRLNNEVKQSSRTSDLIFGIPRLVSFISGIMTLLPGDVIATGTPSGVGQIKNGDVVEIIIERIGTLRNFAFQQAG